MANYDRRILVPYLQDVCCAEMVCEKLEQDVQKARAESDKLTQWANGDYRDPEKPTPRSCRVKMRKGFGFLAICGIFLSLISLQMLPFFWPLGIFAGMCGFPMLLIVWTEYEPVRKESKRRYEQALKAYEEKLEQNQKYRGWVSGWEKSAQQWKQRETEARNCLESAKRVRSRLYGVNVIPSRYRTIHSAYYLYDYFSSCRETDLDKIIQTMLLDEIVKRMDVLIAQNQTILINQRMQIAMQERQNRMIAENQRQQMRQIAQLERNQQLQLDYQEMIARNQEMTNFFLAADYLRRYK